MMNIRNRDNALLYVFALDQEATLKQLHVMKADANDTKIASKHRLEGLNGAFDTRSSCFRETVSK